MKIINRTITRKKRSPNNDIDDLVERYKETALTVRRSMMLIITFTVFCLAVLLVSDEYLIPELGKTIKTTLFSLPLSVKAFVFIGPAILMVTTFYFNTFLKELKSSEMNGVPEHKKLPLLLTFNTKRSRFLSIYLSSFNVPIIMLAYSVKINPHPDAIYFYLFTLIVITVIFIKSLPIDLKFKYIFMILILPLSVVYLKYIEYFDLPNRGYQLNHLVINNKFDMSHRNFNKASLKYAKLENLKLNYSNFAYANMTNVNLTGAELFRADLSGANLSRADLSGANLSGAKLTDADLIEANLIGASLSKANLSKANLAGADLAGANLSKANLYKASLARADLAGANLSKANLYKASLYKANLTGANLTHSNITCEQISKAKKIDSKNKSRICKNKSQ